MLLMAFVGGWAISNYNVGNINLWLKQSIEMSLEKIQEEESSDADPTDIEEDYKDLDLSSDNDDMISAHGLLFSKTGMSGLPPLVIAPKVNTDYLLVQYEDGTLKSRSLLGEDDKAIQGEAYLIDGADLLLQEKTDKASKFYSRRTFKNGKAELVWRTEMDQVLHHFGEHFQGIAYVPGRQFFRMPGSEMETLFAGKPFSQCTPKLLLTSEVITLFDWDTGTIIEEIPLLPIIAKFNDPYIDVVMGNSCADSIHLNDIRILRTQDQADLFPDGKIGDMLISMRHINTIMLLDKDTHENKWFITGLFNNQHSPRITERGTLLVYDNLGSLPKNGLNRILEIDIKTQEILGLYEAQGDDLFFSDIRGRIQLLGDRIFIQEHKGGRLFEIRCPEDQKYLSTECKKQLIFEVDEKIPRKKFFNVGEFVEFE
ncbi:MAG TPA: arylsulfotransferase family protein [Candidatus Gracilibacteria bacterium]